MRIPQATFQGFTPRSLPGCQLWLDASQATLVRGAGMASQFTLANLEYLSNAGTAALRGATGSWFRSGWIYLDALITDQVVMTASTILDNVGFDLRYLTASGKLQLTVGNGTAEKTALDPTVLSGATWYHWYIEYDGTNIGISVNDDTITQTALAAAYSAGTNAVNIGASLTPLLYVGGRMQCIMGGDTALTTGQRTTLYNSGVPLAYDQLDPLVRNALAFAFELNEPSGTRVDLVATANNLTDNNTVTTAAGTVLNAVGTWRDLSGQGNNATQATQANKPVIRVASASVTTPGGTRVIKLDGTNDSFALPTATNLQFGTGDFTLNVLLDFPLAGSSVWNAIITNGFSTSLPADRFALYSANTADQLAYQDSVSLGLFNINYPFVNEPTSGYHLITVSRRNGTDHRFYIDGKLNGTATGAGIANFTTDLTIGTSAAEARYLKNSLSEVVIYNRALNDAEVSRLAHYMKQRKIGNV